MNCQRVFNAFIFPCHSLALDISYFTVTYSEACRYRSRVGRSIRMANYWMNVVWYHFGSTFSRYIVYVLSGILLPMKSNWFGNFASDVWARISVSVMRLIFDWYEICFIITRRDLCFDHFDDIIRVRYKFSVNLFNEARWSIKSCFLKHW